MNGFWWSPFVVAQRLPLIMMETFQNPIQTGKDASKLESHRMITEKWSAMVEGTQAAWSESLRQGMSINMALIQGSIPSATMRAAEAPGRIAEEAFKPASKTVMANAKRLMRP